MGRMEEEMHSKALLNSPFSDTPNGLDDADPSPLLLHPSSNNSRSPAPIRITVSCNSSSSGSVSEEKSFTSFQVSHVFPSMFLVLSAILLWYNVFSVFLAATAFESSNVLVWVQSAVDASPDHPNAHAGESRRITNHFLLLMLVHILPSLLLLANCLFSTCRERKAN